MRSIHFLAVLIVLATYSGLARAEFDSAGGASLAKPAITQANKQVQPNPFRDLAVARFVGLAAVGKVEVVVLKPIIFMPVGRVPAMKPAKGPMRIKIRVPNPPAR
jgi:hypothetical protein